MNPIDHFVLTPDAGRIVDTRTGASWDTKDAMRAVFAPEPRGETLAMDSRLSRRPNRHPMLARDQSMPQPAGMTYNQDQDPSAAPISGSDCLQFVQLCLAKLVGPDRDQFLSGLVDLISPEEGGMDNTLEIIHRPNGNGTNGNGLRSNNQGALDRNRRNGARDQRRPAQDSAIRSLQTSNFARRWPDAAKVSLSGNGR
jgi:hypothetical protein